MMNSKSPFCVRTTFTTFEIPTAPACVVVVDDLRLERDKKGNCIYKKVGDINISDYINSFKDGCSLQDLLNRCKLMTPQAKINYLQQNVDGFSADLTNIPKDGTEAYIMLSKIKNEHPDVFNKFASGESFDNIIKSIIPDNTASSSENNNNDNGGTDNG